MEKNNTEIHQLMQLLWCLTKQSLKNILPNAKIYGLPTIPGMQQNIEDILPQAHHKLLAKYLLESVSSPLHEDQAVYTKKQTSERSSPGKERRYNDKNCTRYYNLLFHYLQHLMEDAFLSNMHLNNVSTILYHRLQQLEVEKKHNPSKCNRTCESV